MTRIYTIIFGVLFLSSQQFFGFLGIPQSMISTANRIAIPLMGCYAIVWLFKRKISVKFGTCAVVVLIGLIVNLVFSAMENGVSVGSGFFAMQSFWFLGIYFVLDSFSLKTNRIENIIISFALTYALIYLVQLQIYPRAIIKSALTLYDSSEAGEVLDSRGTIRFRGPGGGVMMLGYFLLFNRYLVSRRIWSIVGCFIIFTVLVYGGFRSLLTACIIASIIMYFRVCGVSLKRIFILSFSVVIVAGFISQTYIFDIIRSMAEETKTQNVLSKDYIRWEEFRFYVFEMPRSTWAYFLGAGYPGVDADKYSLRIAGYILKGLFWQDIGIIGLGVMVGPAVLIGILMIGYQSLKVRLDKAFVYPAAFVLYLLIGSFTSMEFFRVGMFGTLGVALYLLDRFTHETKARNP